jgi:hypothetical protein
MKVMLGVFYTKNRVKPSQTSTFPPITCFPSAKRHNHSLFHLLNRNSTNLPSTRSFVRQAHLHLIIEPSRCNYLTELSSVEQRIFFRVMYVKHAEKSVSQIGPQAQVLRRDQAIPKLYPGLRSMLQQAD